MIAKLAYESQKLLKYKEQNPELLQQNDTILLVSGLNDTVSFQFIFCPENDSYSFGVSGEPCFLAEGAFESYRLCVDVAADFAVSQQIIGYVDDNDGTCYGDILLNDSHIFVENRHQMSAAFISVHVPKNAAEGKYHGEAKLYCRTRTQDERLECTLPFTFTVYSKIIPPLSDSNFMLDLWQHNCNIARKHETQLWSDRHFEIIERYVATLAALGQKSITVVASEAPWNGQSPEYSREYVSNFYEYSPIIVRRETNGKFMVDFSYLLRLLNIYFSSGIDAEIEIFGLMSVWQNSPDRWEQVCDHPIKCRVRYLDASSGEYKFMRDPNDITFYIGEIYNFFDKQGLLDKARIASDEPHSKQEYQQQLEFYHKNFPKFKFKTAFSDGLLARELSEVGDIAVLLPELTKNLPDLKKNCQNGSDLLYYTCGAPNYPNTFIHSPLLESRVLPILSARLGLNGYLRWSYTAWPQSPRKRLAYRWQSGDTCLVYPSSGGEALLSLRYKNLQRGLQEVALLNLSDTSAKTKYFEQIFTVDNPAEFYASANLFYTLSPETFAKAKVELLT